MTTTLQSTPLRIECKVDPVIILGMHRSGTTMIAELLDRLGLFVGTKVQGDHEAVYFLDINEELFTQIHAFWDNPQPVVSFFNEPRAVEMSARCVRTDILSRSAAEFLGWKRYLKYKTLANLDTPWGWKDPRTVFTLPLWLQLFPTAKIINIIRNGVDVASSLRVREQKMLDDRLKNFDRKFSRRSKRSKLESAGYKGSARCLTLEGGFSLWREYVEQAERNLQILPNPIHTIRYEDFLNDPQSHLKTLAQFCNLRNIDDTAIADAATTVNNTRANAFVKDPGVRTFYDQVKSDPFMQRHDYDHVL